MVTLTSGKTIKTKLIVDATGHESKLVLRGRRDDGAMKADVVDVRGAVTLVDDYHCLGTPLLQLLLSLQRAVAHKRGAASSLLISLQSRVSLSHYKRQLHGAPHR